MIERAIRPRLLDPFLGSGSTALACILEGVDWIGIEREAEYVEIAKARVAFMQEHVRKHGRPPIDMGTAQAVKDAEAKDGEVDERQVDLFDLANPRRE